MSQKTMLSDKEKVNDNKSDIYSYHLTLFSEADEMYELWLPKIAEGYYQFSNQSQHRFLSVIAKNGKWYAQCMKPAYFKDVPIDNSDEIPLDDKLLLTVDVEDRTYLLLVEQVIPCRNTFKNYNTLSDVEIIIGSQAECDIYYRGPFVAKKHAMLLRTGGRWTINNLDTEYGIYVNKEKCEKAELALGDVVYIMGLKLIVGQSFLTINSGLGEVVVNPRILQDMPMIHSGYTHYYGTELESNAKFFNRAPRKRRESEQTVITVEGPPMSMSQNQIPLMLRMGSSMVMGGTAAMAGNFMTLITSVMFPFLSSKYTDAQRKEYEQLRVTKYTEYLENKRKEILAAIQKEHSELNVKYPSLDRVAKTGKSERLWERRPSDSDFLQLRLGTGTRALSARIDYPEKRFELESDDLEDKMYQLVETPYKVEDAPIVLPLIDAYVCGIQGQRKNILSMIRNLVTQIAVHHSYDEVKLVFLLRQEELSEIESVRYLPHTWDDMRNMRFVATSETEAYAIGEYMKNQLEDESKDKKDLSKLLKNRPYYVIFALDKKLLDGHEVFKQFLQEDQNPGVSVITAYDEVPKECQKIVSLQGQQNNTCTTMGIDGGDDEVFSAEDLTTEQFHSVMHLLANTSLKQVDKKQTMPKMVTFLEMLKVGRVEQLNPLKRWRENDPVKSLSTPVGVGEDGSVFMLDLHEKRQGPHGLVAGMTGSGKSEFLITYILSMAVNYHPDEVSFVLIDYKGGGLADAFENPRTGVKLPHLAGTITNLDGASIQRSLMSIESELVRRQKVFSEISKDFDEGSMNIYTYQKLYRAGKVSEPMPHLFIVSDEFAELKQQQPEFMDKLISAARIGRSLGVHLILATQKPSGVVNDQIRSNTKFRVCLRVQDRSDSQDMLKRPEAAELTDTGRFYLQVGYNEYFALGQSAWCGADYEPQDTVPVQRDDAVEFLDMTGQVVTKNKPKAKKTRSGMTQIGAVVQHLSDLASHHNIASRQLWKPALPDSLDLETYAGDSLTESGMNLLLGALDDPENQEQFPLYVNFESCGNLLIAGESGAGKTVIVQNILYMLSKKLPPDEFNFYVLDYSSRMLKVFKDLPHCGAILQDEDASMLDEFFKLISGLIAERKQLFSELEVDSFEAARNKRKIPLVLVVIDNLSGLSNSKEGERINYKLQTYLQGSATYGIKYIVTGSNLNELPPRLRNEFSETVCLHLREKYDYSEILGCKVSYTPPELPGRGMCNYLGRPLEFHSCIFRAHVDSNNRFVLFKQEAEELCAQYGLRSEAQRLSVIDEFLEYRDFAMQFKKDRIPLGYCRNNQKAVALPIRQLSELSIYLGNAAGIRSVLQNLLFAFRRDQMSTWIVKKTQNSLFDINNEDMLMVDAQETKMYGSDAMAAEALQTDLVNLIMERLDLAKVFNKEGVSRNSQENVADLFYHYMREKTVPVVILFENFSDFCKTLDATTEFVLAKYFSFTRKLNIYLVGLFEPDDDKKAPKSMLYSCFNKERTMLFLGGQTDKQAFCELPERFQLNQIAQFNAGVMHYRKGFYSILMPCGQIEQAVVDPDSLSIF